MVKITPIFPNTIGWRKNIHSHSGHIRIWAIPDFKPTTIPKKFSISSPPNIVTQQMLLNAIRHQNILGWDMFLKGFISKHWGTTQALDSTKNTVRDGTDSDAKLTNSSLSLYRNIWDNRNKSIYGSSIKEAREKARKSILCRVQDIYKYPPKLDGSITSMAWSP